MKRKIFVIVILILALIMSMFTGCAEKEAEPLRICVDVTYTQDYGDYYEPIDEAMERFLTQLENAGGPTDIVVECIPPRGADRETTLDRIRVEIASGSGPDIFITNCDIKDSFHTKEPLFLMPEKSMSLDLFLPLDEYMENNTQYAEWDKMNPVVLAAGRDDEGQQIIPLSYTIPISVYKQSEAQHTPSKEITWADMMESKDMVLAASAVWTDNTNLNEEGCPFILSRDALPEFILGDLADYGEEELLFTEEELEQCFEDIYALAERYTAGEFDSVPLHYNAMAGTHFMEQVGMITDSDGATYDSSNGINMYDPMTMVPLYSEDGGVTASITAYAAINRNTQRPEDAYSVVDFLLSVEAQRTGGLYQYLYNSDDYSLPMHNEVMNGKENSLYVLSLENPDHHRFEHYMPETNFEALRAVRDQITHAQFRDVLDVQLNQAYWDYDRAVKYGSDDPNEALAEAYRRMQQMLRE